MDETPDTYTVTFDGRPLADAMRYTYLNCPELQDYVPEYYVSTWHRPSWWRRLLGVLS